MSFTLSKTQITAGSTGNVITLTGTGTSWSGSAQFSITSGPGTITAQSTSSATSGSVTITGGAAYGVITISDGSTTAQLVNAPANTKVVSTDNFNRANSSPGGVGNGWIDHNNIWEINSDTALGTSGPYDFTTASIFRPETEAFINGQVWAKMGTLSGGQFTLYGRLQETTDALGDRVGIYMIPNNTGGNFNVFTIISGTFTTYSGAVDVSTPNGCWLQLILNGSSVVANIYQPDGVTLIQTITDTVPGPLTAGSAGFCQSFNGYTPVAEFDAYQTLAISPITPAYFKAGVSTTLTLTGQGTSFNGSSVTATNATISSQSASSTTSATVTLTATNAGPVVLTDSISGAQGTVTALDPLVVTYDTFNRANTSVGSGANSTNMGPPDYYYSPSTGGSWIDFAGDIWQITSNVAISAGGQASEDLANTLYRPSVEYMVNGKSQLIFNNNWPTASGKYPELVGRFTPASGGSGYGAVLQNSSANASVAFIKQVNGVQTYGFATVNINQQFLPQTNLLLEFCVQQKNSTTTTLTINIYNPSAPPPYNAPIYTYSTEDTTTALQNVSGSFGASGFQAQADTMISTIAAPSALTIGTLLVTETYKTNVYLGVSEISGGTAPYTVQLHRSTTSGFTPNSGNAVSGATSAFNHDSGLTPNTTYYYKLTVTDATSTTVTSNQASTTTLPSNALVIGTAGDSITEEYLLASENLSAVNQMSLALTAAGIPNVFINCGLGGSSSGDWEQGNAAYLSSANNFPGRDLSFVSYMIGTNDADNGVSEPSYIAAVQNTCAGWLGLGWPTMLHYSPWNTMGSTATNLLLAYQTGINGIVNGTTIYQGDTTAFTQFEANPSWLGDGVHPNATGAYHLGNFWATAIKTAFANPATAYTLTGPSSGTVGIASSNFTVTPNGSFTGTITPSDGGQGGTFTPSSLTFSGTSAAQTFTYTAASTGVKSISTTNSGSLTNPSAISYTANPNTAATAYTLTGPSSGNAAQASSNFIVTPNGLYTGTITPNDNSGGGSFSPSSLTFSNSSAPQTFTYTPATIGVKVIGATNNGGLTNPASLNYTSNSTLVAPTVTLAPYASGVAVSWSTSDTGVTFNINHNGTVTDNVTSPDDFVVADLTQSNYWKVQSVNATGAGPFSNAVYLGGSSGGSSGGSGGMSPSPNWNW